VAEKRPIQKDVVAAGRLVCSIEVANIATVCLPETKQKIGAHSLRVSVDEWSRKRRQRQNTPGTATVIARFYVWSAHRRKSGPLPLCGRDSSVFSPGTRTATRTDHSLLNVTKISYLINCHDLIIESVL
jgi:hypothetical protein